MEIDINNISPAIWGPVIALAAVGLIGLVCALAFVIAIWSDAKDAEKGGE